MQSIMRRLTRPGLWLGLGIFCLGAVEAEAQTYYPQTGTYYPPAGRSGTWSGYQPNSPWSGYAPGSAWSGYAPGTPAVGTVPPAVVGGAPATTTQPGYTYVAPTPGRRTLLNGVRYPVRGPTPYADGRSRAYYEYGTGRGVPLAKPWLSGAPGGRR